MVLKVGRGVGFIITKIQYFGAAMEEIALPNQEYYLFWKSVLSDQLWWVRTRPWQ